MTPQRKQHTCTREERRPAHAQVGEQERIWRAVTEFRAFCQCMRARREEGACQSTFAVHRVPTCRVGRARTMAHKTNAISLLSLEAASIASRTFPARNHSQQPQVPVVVYAVAPQGAPVAALERYRTNLALLNRIHQRDLRPDPTRPRNQSRAGTVPAAADCGSQALFPAPPRGAEPRRCCVCVVDKSARRAAHA